MSILTQCQTNRDDETQGAFVIAQSVVESHQKQFEKCERGPWKRQVVMVIRCSAMHEISPVDAAASVETDSVRIEEHLS